MGSIVASTNHLGTPQHTTTHDAWGNITAQSGTQGLYGYTGREPDQTGLVYYRARYYHPQLGRFTQRDPLGFTDGINLYTYVGNAPTNFTDPSGMLKAFAGPLISQGSQYIGAIGTGIAQGFIPTGEDISMMMAGGGAALADGPLPFGDAVLLGATAVYGVKSVGRSVDNVIDGVSGVAKGLDDVWGLSPTMRGTAIETQLAQTDYKGWFNVGNTNNGFFPLVDFQKENTLVSLKSVNTNGSTWMGRMQSHIRDLGSRGASINGRPANMVLDLRVQPGGARAAQQLIEFGRNIGVNVIIKEF